MLLRTCLRSLTVFLIASTGHAAGSENFSSTLIGSNNAGQVQQYVFPVKVLLPKNVVKRIANDGTVPDDAKLILDREYGEYYRLTQTSDGITKTVEGLKNSQRTAAECLSRSAQEVIYGTNEPRDSSGSND